MDKNMDMPTFSECPIQQIIMDEISIFVCNLCFEEWDGYENFRKYRLKKCCVCHDEICKTCFFNKDNKQKCFSCTWGKTPKDKYKSYVRKNIIIEIMQKVGNEVN